MLKRLTVFIMVAFSLTDCQGQGHARSFTYRLHKPRDDGKYSTLHSMPDGALLSVTKRFDQPKQIWNLLRIRNWDSSAPREDKLDVDVGPNEELFGYLSWESQGDGYDRNDQLLMDPEGNYLVVRLSPDAFAWNVNHDESKKPRAVLNIIDLHSFKLLRRVALADPLLAGGDMGFSPKGNFMVSGVQEQSSATAGGNVTHTRQYAVEALTLPSLEPATACTYTIVSTTFSNQTLSPAEESKRIDEELERKQNQKQGADAACRPGLARLGFSSLDDVQQNLNLSGRLTKDLNYTGHVPNQGPWGCNFEDLSGNLQYELLDCDQSRVVVFGRYRAFRVFHLADGKQIMELKVPRRTLSGDFLQFSGVLATSNGVTYVVLLREGAELEGYRVP